MGGGGGGTAGQYPLLEVGAQDRFFVHHLNLRCVR